MNDWSDEQLRQAFAAHGEEAGKAHLTPADLSTLARGELSPEDAGRWIDHLSACSACAEDYRLTRELLAAEHADDVALSVLPAGNEPAARIIPRPHRRPRRNRNVAFKKRWLPALAAAAALVIATGIVFELGRGPQEPAPYRHGGADLQILSRVQDGAALPPTALRLEWTPIDGARYDVVLMTVELEVLAQARFLDQAIWLAPRSAVAAVPAGSILIWQVEAIEPDGERLSSAAFEIILAAPLPGE